MIVFKYKRLIGIIWLFLFLIFIKIETLFAQSSQNFQLRNYVIDAAGQTSASSGFKLVDAAGQPSAVGFSEGSNHNLSAGFLENESSIIDAVEIPENQMPTTYRLSQNYPNPFNPSTTIEFELPRTAEVELVIYNVLGQKLKVLANQEFQAGYHNLTWDGMDGRGTFAGSGVYIIIIRAKSNGSILFQDTGKMLLIK